MDVYEIIEREFNLDRFINAGSSSIAESLKINKILKEKYKLGVTPGLINLIVKSLIKNAPADIYYFKSGDFIKIGFTKNVGLRLNSVRTDSPLPVTCLAVHRGSKEDEKLIHEKFKEDRVHGEWFRFSEKLKNHIINVRRS